MRAKASMKVRVSIGKDTETQQDVVPERVGSSRRKKGELKSFKTRPMRRNDTSRAKDLRSPQINNRLSIY